MCSVVCIERANELAGPGTLHKPQRIIAFPCFFPVVIVCNVVIAAIYTVSIVSVTTTRVTPATTAAATITDRTFATAVADSTLIGLEAISVSLIFIAWKSLIVTGNIQRTH